MGGQESATLSSLEGYQLDVQRVYSFPHHQQGPSQCFPKMIPFLYDLVSSFDISASKSVRQSQSCLLFPKYYILMKDPGNQEDSQGRTDQQLYSGRGFRLNKPSHSERKQMFNT